MSDVIIVALLASVGPTLMGLGSLIVSLENKKQLKVVHKLSNSNLKRQTKLLEEANQKIEQFLKEKRN